MKKLFLIIFILVTESIYADAVSVFQECLIWMSKSENDVIQNGATKIKEMDMGAYGGILKIYTWFNNGVGYTVTTSNGIISNIEGSIPIVNIREDGMLLADVYRSKEIFDTDVSNLINIARGYNGRMTFSNVYSYIRSENYGFSIENIYKVSFEIFTYISNTEENGFGSINIKISR